MSRRNYRTPYGLPFDDGQGEQDSDVREERDERIETVDSNYAYAQPGTLSPEVPFVATSRNTHAPIDRNWDLLNSRPPTQEELDLLSGAVSELGRPRGKRQMGLARQHRTKQGNKQLYATIWQMRCQGYSELQIMTYLNENGIPIQRPGVVKALRRYGERLAGQQALALDEERMRQVDMLRRVAVEALREFDVSRADQTRVVTTRGEAKLNRDGIPVTLPDKQVITQVARPAGDPNLLRAAIDATERISRLLGLDADKQAKRIDEQRAPVLGYVVIRPDDSAPLSALPAVTSLNGGRESSNQGADNVNTNATTDQDVLDVIYADADADYAPDVDGISLNGDKSEAPVAPSLLDTDAEQDGKRSDVYRQSSIEDDAAGEVDGTAQLTSPIAWHVVAPTSTTAPTPTPTLAPEESLQ